MPKADEMQKYAAIDPKFAERIISMAEAEMQHRHTLEEKRNESNITGSLSALDANKILKTRSQWFALLVTFGGFGVSLGLAFLGNMWGSSLVGTSAVVGLVYAFLYSKTQKREQTTDK